MSMTPGMPPPVVDPIVIRLYDEIKEMRTDIAAMRSDFQGLATSMHQALQQGGDHEQRLRTLEKSATTTEALEARDRERDRDFEARLRANERHSWKTAGVAAVGSLLVESGIALLIVKVATKH